MSPSPDAAMTKGPGRPADAGLVPRAPLDLAGPARNDDGRESASVHQPAPRRGQRADCDDGEDGS